MIFFQNPYLSISPSRPISGSPHEGPLLGRRGGHVALARDPPGAAAAAAAAAPQGPVRAAAGGVPYAALQG